MPSAPTGRPGKAQANEGVKKSSVPGSAAVPLDVRKACGFPASSPNDLLFSLVCGKAQPFHTSGGKAAIFSHL
jgi:hypothetical protein